MVMTMVRVRAIGFRVEVGLPLSPWQSVKTLRCFYLIADAFDRLVFSL
jgi:hypothetical protein